MILGEKSVRTYKLNKDTTVTVKSEMKADKVYSHEIIVQKKEVTVEPLQFINKQAVADLVEGFDLDQDQTSLIG